MRLITHLDTGVVHTTSAATSVNIPFSLELAINLNNKTSGVYYYMFVDVHNLELLRLYITVYIGTVELVLRRV